ncbi:MAG: hypothetical protein PGN27_16715 [Mycolicibacterium neoaurum]|uniref:LppU/SCO3897 family protein n=1 Tax=Mycolicibacterium neoaurum TaxID=1795 RepID=UPI002FFB0FBC
MSLTARAVMAMVLTVLVTGCGSDDLHPNSTPFATSESAEPARDLVDIPGQFPQPATMTESGGADAPVGGCVNVSGTPARAVLDVADCMTPLATYRVIQRVLTPDQCVADADRPFYFRDAYAQWTACLDLNWDSTYCIDVGAVTTKVACEDPAATRKLKPASVLLDTTTTDDCSEGGYPHPLRRFTICTEARS